jgi:GxxExxY protein
MTLDDLTYKINGCAMKVHNTLGNGFQELIYQRCLAIELERAEISFEREQSHTIYYEGIDVGTRRADFIIEDTVVVELKAVINLEDVHLAQAKNYVVAYDKPIGLLINFGSTSLQFKKVFNPKYNHRQNQDLQNSKINRIKDENIKSANPCDDRSNFNSAKILQSNNPLNPDSDK